jgi:hypothetical protein
VNAAIAAQREFWTAHAELEAALGQRVPHDGHGDHQQHQEHEEHAE